MSTLVSGAREMAILKGTCLFIESVESLSARPAHGVYFHDKDGARIYISRDVLAHLISVMHHEMTRDTKEELSIEAMARRLCACPKE